MGYATGSFQTDGIVTIENYHLPQFTRKRHTTSSFHMFQKRSKDKYDFILGRDLLTELSIDIRYSTAQFVWENIIGDMVPRNYWTEQKIRNIAKTWNVNKREHNVEELHLAEILPADYKPLDINEVVQKQTHLCSDERDELLQALKDFQELFQGKPGEYKGKPIELELLSNTKPFYAKPFSIPKAYQQITKDEISRLENIGILTKVPSSEWAAPTFVIPKKNKTVRLITDFCGLNKCLKRSPYPMPKISDIFKGMEKFNYATTIDLNMDYYSMPLLEQSKKLCIICLPWGLYQYNVLPQGVKPATDIFQQRMGELFYDLSTTDSFMDDIIVNPDKCMLFQTEVTYLGFIITRDGIKPQPEKIQGILNMMPPKTQKDVRRFVGMINFYRDLYPKRAETLAPLTDLCGHKRKFTWEAQHEQAFQQMKEITEQDIMLTYPQFDKPFHIYTDASELQIGGVIMQDSKPLGFFSKKLTHTQKKYLVTEQELLAIVETIKYFRHMLLGHRIVVHTDHKNLTHPNSKHSSDHVLQQRLALEEYGVEINYIAGDKNVVADALSRLPTEELFNLDNSDVFSLNLAVIAEKQAADNNLQQHLLCEPPKYKQAVRDGVTLYVHTATQTIYVPVSLHQSILQWYHTSLQHPGIKRMQATIKESFYWPGIDASVESLVRTCNTCQKCKITAVKKYGKNP
jgi:hypothetical protein